MQLNSENLKNLKFKKKKVTLKKAEGEFYVTLIPAELAEEARQAASDTERANDAGFKILQAAVVDEHDRPVFTDQEAFDALPVALQMEFFEAVYEYNGMTEEAVKALEKNFERTQSEDSHSD